MGEVIMTWAEAAEPSINFGWQYMSKSVTVFLKISEATCIGR